MADLLTHLASGRIPGTLLGDRRTEAFLLLGTLLPDLVDKTLVFVLRAPDYFGTVTTHTPAGLLATCYLAALFVEAGLRKRAFGALYAGALLHVAVDLLKDNHGAGVSPLLYPFSARFFELGILRPEDTVYLMPAAAAILAATGARRRHVRP